MRNKLGATEIVYQLIVLHD